MIVVTGKFQRVDMVNGPISLHYAAAQGDKQAAAKLRSFGVSGPRVVVVAGDRVEVKRAWPSIAEVKAAVGDRGTVVSVSPDAVRESFGLDAEQAYVRLDKAPDTPVLLYFKDLSVLSIVDRIGELDAG